jgi:hypothetical protein
VEEVTLSLATAIKDHHREKNGLSACSSAGQQVHHDEDNRDNEHEMDKAATEMQGETKQP